MARCLTNCIEGPMRMGFQAIGHFIGRYPWWFLIIPMMVSAALGGGFYFLKDREANDIEEQFTPVNGPAKKERSFVQANFPENDSMFSVQRLTTEGTYAAIIAVSENNILTKAAFEEILLLYNMVMKITVEGLRYNNICAIVEQDCYSNVILDIIGDNASSIENINITFPMYNSTAGFVFLGSTVGGVQGSVIVEQAHAIRLFFYLQEDQRPVTSLWLKEFIKLFSEEHFEKVSVSYFTSFSRQEEFEANSKTVIPLFAATYALAISFSIVSCLRLDNVRNKVWVATFGVLSAGLAVLSSFGLLLYASVPFVMTVATAPFLILGIGVDDMFVMIACWQQTNVHASVEDRLADTYKEAAISITITTLTDLLAFYIGISTPFRSVQSFCLYTGTAVLFCYILNITFFGAVLALNGRREESNRHWLTCMTIPQECPPERSGGYSICCVGGAYDKNTNTEVAQPISYFFLKYYGPFLTKKYSKISVVILYVLYLCVSIYGCFNMQEGIDLKNLASDDSYVVQYYTHEDKYFSEYGPNVMIVVKNTLPYWEESERSTLDKCLKNFVDLFIVDPELFTSWLDAYNVYLKKSSLDINNKTIFLENLPPFFVQAPVFKQDLNFTNQEIHASRFFIQTVNITSSEQEKEMLNVLRQTAERCLVPLLVYHPTFIFYDQYAVIRKNTIQNILVATVVMLVISLLLIPNPLCSLWVTFAIASVIVGVAGFMMFWDINLDSVSMINLVICIGFSVDFSAHISYSFVSSSKPIVNERAIDALYSLGYPIVQGAISTILGVVVLAAAESYIFRTFFKIMFLVISFGLLHGIVFIPVFLTFFGFCSRKTTHS
ncbi:patched domain-containing protein 3 [Conger conger]|uniref:patched domain-containing protein 3 n=1 Tax=Conger conger TaxID=82655 RepID=UPI002A5ACC8E|nr:patched domain-containing protein 3 [Conger conger]